MSVIMKVENKCTGCPVREVILVDTNSITAPASSNFGAL